MQHSDLVIQQFGDQAQAYLHSSVHAQGAELQALASIVRERPGAEVLDLGSGAGHVSFTVAPWARRVVAYDLSASMLDTVETAAAQRSLENITTREGAAEQLPFADNSFDFVFSRYSAHHWADPSCALWEVSRVLRPAGQAVFVDVVSPGVAVLDTHLQAVEVLRDTSHVRDYSVAEWLGMVTGAGLSPTEHRMQRLRLEFDAWTERMRTPAVFRQAIRLLQNEVGEEVRRYLDIADDGSFTTDVLVLHTTK